MDGFTATGAIRDLERGADRAPAFIVALTAHVTGPEAARWQEAGMNAYVAKPFTIAQLSDVLGRCAAPDMIRNGTTDLPKPEPVPSAPSGDWEAIPLLAAETLAMFDALSAAKGQALGAKVFGLFRSHAPRAFNDLKNGLDGPADGAAKLAHALKSMCLSAGAGRAAAICGGMENKLKAGDLVQEAEVLLLLDAIDKTGQEMNGYLASFNTQAHTTAR
jgi:two-component system sensor histidine kinase BarA